MLKNTHNNKSVVVDVKMNIMNIILLKQTIQKEIVSQMQICNNIPFYWHFGLKRVFWHKLGLICILYHGRKLL